MISAVMLGCGTSTGVPVVGCSCDVCQSPDRRNQRSRASLWLRWQDGHCQRSVVIDTGPDFRSQALRARIERVDALLFTHAHADHIMGLDDVRPYNFRQQAAIDCYGAEATMRQIRNTFAYAFDGPGEGGGVPRLNLHSVDSSFELFGEQVRPVPVLHGSQQVLGFRFRDFAYITDVSAVPESSVELLQGLDSLVLGALRYRPHPTHFSIEEAVACIEHLGPRKAFLTHLAHDVDASSVLVSLPPSIELGYDGLAFEV